AARQGEGRGRRADRRAMDPRTTAQPDVLQPRRGQPRHRRAPSAAERASVQEAAWLKTHALRAARPTGARTAPGAALRVRRLEEGARAYRLSRGARRPLLLRPLSARQNADRGAANRAYRGDLPS